MQNDQRLTPLPLVQDIQPTHIDYSAGYTPSYDDSLDNKRSLRQYFNVVYKRLPIILAITILVTAAAAFYSFRQPSIYEATTEMLIEPRKAQVTQKDAININFGDDEKYYKTQLQLLQNQGLMKRVVIALGLHREPNLFGNESRGLMAGLRSLFSGGQKPQEEQNSLPVITPASTGLDGDGNIALTPEENARAEAYANEFGVRVAQVERTNIVNVTIITSRQDLAAKVADKVAEQFKEEDTERATAGARKAFEDLQKSIEELKETIARQELDLMAIMREENLPLQEKGQDLAANRLQTLSGQWLDAINERRKLEARYNAAVQASNRNEGMNIPDLNQNPVFVETMRINTERKGKLQDTIREIDKQIQEQEALKRADSVKYTDEHPNIKGYIAKIESLKDSKARTEEEVSKIIESDQKKIEKNAVGGALVGLKSQLDAEIRREGQLAASYAQEAQRANIQGQAHTKLTTANREMATNRLLLDTYTQRQKEQELALLSDRPKNISISRNAAAPGGPTGPMRGRNIMIAFLLSLAAGIGLAFLLDYLDDSVRTSDDVTRHLGLPTLALIPHYLNNEKKSLLPAKNGATPFQAAALITLTERHSPLAEAYRHLRTSLLFSSAGKPPQTILVTSSQPSEGKTTTAINTAITLAQADADVVIVDCDLRRPRLHTHFGLDNTQGLTNYLSGDKNTENMIRTYADLPRLKIITSGPIPPNPAELLSSNEMRNLLQFLSTRFKHVIVDSPPAISFTDASILSTLVDGVVLVAMANKSSIHLMRQFKQRVSSIGARIYGVVLNGIKANSTEYYYYGSGYYKYYSKSEEDESTPLMEETTQSRQG
ncbi:MAG TPA: polysaccharide biosynthesis tyrosine autokinase [Pyrinomonadaceae bacterium]|nr:polysaccharide biosynthesis tyrosine autokinase [Pyrinomonadaceae bacterium]